MARLFALGFALLAAGAIARADVAQITVDPNKIIAPVSPYLTGVCLEDVNHEVYGGIYSQLVFGESFQEPEGTAGSGLSKWWKPVGTAQGKYELVHEAPFVGAQSQRLTFVGGEGFFGIANRGLNGQGIFRPADGGFNGELWARAAKPVALMVGIADEHGAEILTTVAVPAGNWQRVPFSFGSAARQGGPVGNNLHFEIGLKKRGTVDLGYVFIGPEPSRLFKGSLPERSDVAEKMVALGTTVVRYGGSMINDPAYRWKNMIGPRARRPPTHGTWYPYSSNGWGIPDFCAFTDAAGFLGIPAFNMGETPQDMADFIEYAHGPASTKWGAQRIADGYKQAFKVHIIELGNEEQVNDDYWKKFEPIARAIWSKEPKMILTVGDLSYDDVITDPMNFKGGHVTSLAAHQKILALAKEYGAEVWFDVHIWDQEVANSNSIAPLVSYIAALKQLSNGAKFHVVTYELNANTHDLNRALANARMINMLERAGAEPVVTSANALQVDGQNDNGWNQGLIFMNPEKVWVQPPGYVMQMISKNRLTNVVQSTCNDTTLDVTATVAPKAGIAKLKTVSLQVVNAGDVAKQAVIKFPDNCFWQATTATELSGELSAVNTATAPDTIKPVQRQVNELYYAALNVHQNPGSKVIYNFLPHSFTVLRLKEVARY